MKQICACSTLCLLLSICSCVINNANNENKLGDNKVAPTDVIVNLLSRYYCISNDTILKHYKITESGDVKTVDIRFYHFYDERDTTNEKNHWVEGVIAINNTTGNNFIISSKLQGYNEIRPDYYNGISFLKNVHHKIPKGNPNQQLYEDTFKILQTRSVEVLQERNRGIAMKLSAILNDIPICVKANLTRSIIDSIIRNYLYSDMRPSDWPPEVLRKEDSTEVKELISFEKEMKSQSDKVMFYRKIPGYSLLNQSQLQLDFAYFIKSKIYNENAFVYFHRSSILFQDMTILVLINDELKSKSINNQDYYSTFNNEPVLFDIKIYSDNL